MINNILIISKNPNPKNFKIDNQYDRFAEILTKEDYNLYFGSYNEESLTWAETNNFDLIIIKCDFYD